MGAEVVVTQLVVNASGANAGVAEFEAAMGRAKKAANENGTAITSFEQAQRKWIKSLADTDPVLRAQVQQQQALQRQMDIGRRSVELGISTEQAHVAQLERVREKYQGYIVAAEQAQVAQTGMGKATALLMSQLGPLIGIMSAATVIGFAKSSFERAASLNEEAIQVGIGVENYQAYLAVMLESGIKTDQASNIIQRLTRSIGDAQQQAGPARNAFVQLGISVDTLRGGAEQTLPAIAAGLLAIADPAQRAAIEVDLFGKSGQRLESALRALVDPTSTIIEQQRALGQVLSQDVTEAADKAADDLTRSWNRMKNNLAEPTSWLLTQLNDIVAAFGEIGPASAAADAEWQKRFGGLRDNAGLRPRVNADAAAPLGFNNFGSSSVDLHQLSATGGYSSQNLDTVMSKLREQAEITGKTAVQQAQIVALREAEAASIKDGNGALSDAQRLEVMRLSSVKASADTSAKAAAARQAANAKEDADQEKFNQWVTKLSDQNDRINEKIRDRKKDQEDIIQGLRDEVTLAGMTREEAQVQSEVWQVVKRLHVDIGSAEAKEVEALVRQRQEMDRGREVIGDIANETRGYFRDVLENGGDAFGNLWDRVKGGFFDLLADMATQALIAPVIIPVLQSIGGLTGGATGAGGGALSLLSSAGSLSSLFSGGDMFGLGGANGLLNSLGGSLGFSSQTAIGLNEVGGLSFAQTPGSLFGSTTLGGALSGMGVGALASSLIFGNKNSAGIGGMAGALLGQLAIPIPIVGGLIGGLIGGGLGSMTGTSNQGAISNFTNNGLGNTLFKAGGGNNGQMATQATGTINQALKALQDAGVNISLGNISGLSIGSDKSYVYDFAGGKQKLAGGEAGIQATVNAIFDRIGSSASASTPEAQAILDKYGSITSGNYQQVVADLGAVQQFMDAINGLDISNDNLSATARAIKAINDQIDPLVAQAQALGISTDKLEAYRAKAIDAATAAIGLQDLGNSINDLAGEANDAARAATAAARSWAQAHDNVQKASTALLISDQSLSPTARYSAVRNQFDALAGRGLAGDVGAANDAAGFASTFAQESFSFNGSTTAYGSDFAYIQRTLAALTDYTSTQQSAADKVAESAAQQVTLLAGIKQAIETGNESGSGALQELSATVADLATQIKNNSAYIRATGG